MYDKGRVTIISRESNDRTLDIELLEEELLRRGVRVKTLCRLLTKDRSIKALGYAGSIIRQEYEILRSDAVVVDTYCIPVSMLPHRKRTKILQIWHALGAVKKFGWQSVGKEHGSSMRTARLMRMHKGYDYVASPSDATSEHYCEAFGTEKEKIVKLGLPRIDYIRSISSGRRQKPAADAIRKRYGDLKEVILYAPTFRRDRTVDVKTLAEAIDTDRFTLVVKLHPLYRKGIDVSCDDGVIIDEEFSSYEWLSVADRVISDYSAFIIESALTDKPLYIFAYDIGEYERNTGLNMDLRAEAIVPYVFTEASELAAALKEEYDMKALREFRDKYVDVDTGKIDEDRCTSKMADFIESIADSDRESAKQKLAGFFHRINPGP